MALAALGVSALGSTLGTLAGGAIAGSPEIGFKDVATTKTVTQLDPAQLQQILDDLTRAEGMSREDIQQGTLGALGFLTGDVGASKRSAAIDSATLELKKQKAAEAVQGVLGDALVDVVGAEGANTFARRAQYDKFLQEEIIPNIANTLIFDKQGNPSISEAAFGELWSNKLKNTETGRYTLSQWGDSGYRNLFRRGMGADFRKAIEDRLSRDTVQQDLANRFSTAREEAEAQLRESHPDLFSTEITTPEQAIASAQQRAEIANAQLDPFLRDSQGINLSALRRMQAMSGLTGESAADIQAQLEATPGYQFRMQQGQNAVERQMAAQGLGQSGALLKGLTEFGQGLASQEFGAEHARLASLAGLTTNPALTGSSLAQQTRFGAADLLSGQGTNLANITQQAAAQRSSALQGSGTNTQGTTQSQLFNLANLTPIGGKR